MSISKTIFILALAAFLVLVLCGCGNTAAAEQKYQKSFKNTWDTLMTQNKKTTDRSKAALDAGDIPAVTKAYQQLSSDHKAAEKKLKRLKPPDDLKRLHNLMKTNLRAGYEYADLVVKILGETDGNYTAEQENELKSKEKSWLNAQERVKKELKKYFKIQ